MAAPYCVSSKRLRCMSEMCVCVRYTSCFSLPLSEPVAFDVWIIMCPECSISPHGELFHVETVIFCTWKHCKRLKGNHCTCYVSIVGWGYLSYSSSLWCRTLHACWIQQITVSQKQSAFTDPECLVSLPVLCLLTQDLPIESSEVGSSKTCLLYKCSWLTE